MQDSLFTHTYIYLIHLGINQLPKRAAGLDEGMSIILFAEYNKHTMNAVTKTILAIIFILQFSYTTPAFVSRYPIRHEEL